MSKQKRNAPCDCGSGRKYKHCHGKLTSLADDYRSNPDTFFDVVKPINKPLTKPLELFDFFARSYMDAKKETLLDWMKEYPDADSFQAKSQKDLAEIYCDRMATAMWRREKQWQATKRGEPAEMQQSVAERGSEIIEVKIER